MRWLLSALENMAGLIQLKEHRWSVAGWVFDQVLKVTRPYLPNKDSSKILDFIDEAATGLNYISLDDLSTAELSTFHRALEQAYVDVERKGSNALSTPEFYDGFMKRFEELLQIIRTVDRET